MLSSTWRTALARPSRSFRLVGTLLGLLLGCVSVVMAAPRAVGGGGCNPPAFAPLKPYPGLAPATDIATGDFNGDLHHDLAVANGGVVLPPALPVVAILINNGDGTFQPPVHYPTGGRSGRVAVGDFDGDARVDLFVSTEDASGSVLLGNGDGTFQALIPNLEGAAVDLAVADFNHDGKLDCAAATGFELPFIDVLLGHGDGTFQAPIHVDVGGHQSGIVAGDWNFDGWSDLAVTRPADGLLSVLVNDGAGAFPARTDYATGLGPSALAVGRVDSLLLTPSLPDPKPDLVVVNKGRNSVSIFLGVGDGSFQLVGDYPVGHEPVSVAVGDYWPVDGRLDLAVLNRGSGSVSLLLGNADGTFIPTPGIPGVGSGPRQIASSDFDWDGPGPGTIGFHGYSDLAITDGGTIGVLLGDCPPTAVCSDVTVPADAECTAPASIDAGSFDGDPGDAIALAQSPSGPYPLGQTPVTLMVTDAAGATTECSAVVTVVDQTPPTIDCPSDIQVNTDPGKCTARVTFAPVAADNCPVELIADPPSGSDFAIGTTIVHCTATDAGNLTATCTFTVTVSVGNRCPHSQGYWKTHPEAWPAAAVPMTLGNATYTQPELVQLLAISISSDASLILARQLIAAVLNTANGSDPQPICDVIGQAQALLGASAGKLPLGIPPRSATGQAMLDLADQLEDYNKGQLTGDCVP